MKKAIDRGEVYVNGEKAGTGKHVAGGDIIELFDLQKRAPKPYEIDISVVYEDAHLAVVVKPAGLMTAGNAFKTLQNCLDFNLQKSTEEFALKHARPVHRLDAATSGLIIAAKTTQAQIRLGEMFAAREIRKKYAAVVIGKTAEEGFFNAAIDGKESSTKYERADCVPSLRNEHLSLLHLYPTTGRTHQIRKHTSGAGFPIFGDKLYGKEGEIYKGKGLFLAAIGLEFLHPVSSELLCISTALPQKFTSLLRREKRRWQRLN